MADFEDDDVQLSGEVDQGPGTAPAAPTQGSGRADTKVELDIDDAPFMDMDEEEEPAQAAADPAADAPSEAGDDTGKTWWQKKIIIGVIAGVTICCLLAIGALMMFRLSSEADKKIAELQATQQAVEVKPDPCLGALTPAEVVARVRTAAERLAEAPEAAFKEFQDPKGRWVCGETYIVTFNSAKRLQLTNPVTPILAGLDVSAERDEQGMPYIAKVGEIRRRPQGGWMEKVQPRPDDAYDRDRKVFYILGVPGTPYEVAAGLWNDDLSVEELDARMDELWSASYSSSSGSEASQPSAPASPPSAPVPATPAASSRK